MSKTNPQLEDLINDVKAGVGDTQIMLKYSLSARSLESVLDKMLNRGLVSGDQVAHRRPNHSDGGKLTMALCPSCGCILESDCSVCQSCSSDAETAGDHGQNRLQPSSRGNAQNQCRPSTRAWEESLGADLANQVVRANRWVKVAAGALISYAALLVVAFLAMLSGSSSVVGALFGTFPGALLTLSAGLMCLVGLALAIRALKRSVRALDESGLRSAYSR